MSTHIEAIASIEKWLSDNPDADKETRNTLEEALKVLTRQLHTQSVKEDVS